jgi:hypothetical protein
VIHILKDEITVHIRLCQPFFIAVPEHLYETVKITRSSLPAHTKRLGDDHLQVK